MHSADSISLHPGNTAVLALHWQVNVIERTGFFGALLSEPVAASGVVHRAALFHDAVAATGVRLYFTRFTVPADEGGLVRNTGFMRAVADAQQHFRPDSPGTRIIDPMREQARRGTVVDNQKLSGLADNGLADSLVSHGIDTVLVTGVATNLTVEQTARHATDLGLRTYVISDCITAADETVHAASLANLELATEGCLTADEALRVIGSEA